MLGAAGLLDGRRCTAHWHDVDELAQRFPNAMVNPDVLFVDDGDLITSEHQVSSLAQRAAMSERTFARRFVAETGTTPHKWLSMQRVLHARSLLEDTDLGIESVATRSGFGTAALLRHHFRRVVGMAPEDHRRWFASSWGHS